MSMLTVVSPDAEPLFFGASPRCVNLRIAGSLGELATILRERLPGPAAPVTLDLLGHSTRDHHLLRLGATVLDMLNPHVARFFRRHTEAVVAGVPKERLLVFEVKDGWEPLCAFLGVPVPQTPYPRENTTEQFQARSKAMAAAGGGPMDPDQIRKAVEESRRN